MIKILCWLLLMLFLYIYLKYFEHKPYFYTKEINRLYALAVVHYLYLDSENFVRKASVVVPSAHALELASSLERAYIANIKISELKDI